MRRFSDAVALAALTIVGWLWVVGWAHGQTNNSSNWQTPGNQVVGGVVQMGVNSAGQAVPLGGTSGSAGYPAGATPVVSSASGTTGATTASIAAVASKFSYICGFQISVLENATGGTTSGPITVTGPSATLTYQQPTYAASSANQFGETYSPCLPASAVNTAISVATTANADATSVNVMVWGYQE